MKSAAAARSTVCPVGERVATKNWPKLAYLQGGHEIKYPTYVKFSSVRFFRIFKSPLFNTASSSASVFEDARIRLRTVVKNCCDFGIGIQMFLATRLDLRVKDVISRNGFMCHLLQ